jgi:hypothetical protein
MKLKTLIALAVAGAFAAPLAAQASADSDRTLIAQGGPSGASSMGTGPSGGAATPGGPGQRPSAGEPAAPNERNTGSAAGASGAAGSFSAIDRNGDGYVSREEARNAQWSNRFSELDKDNDGRLSPSEYNAMGSGAGVSSSTGGAVTSPGSAGGSTSATTGDAPRGLSPSGMGHTGGAPNASGAPQ